MDKKSPSATWRARNRFNLERQIKAAKLGKCWMYIQTLTKQNCCHSAYTEQLLHGFLPPQPRIIYPKTSLYDLDLAFTTQNYFCQQEKKKKPTKPTKLLLQSPTWSRPMWILTQASQQLSENSEVLLPTTKATRHTRFCPGRSIRIFWHFLFQWTGLKL